MDKISFTGSTEVGKSIAAAGAANLTRVSLELGGKSPNVVFADADLAAAASGAAWGIFYNMGEDCCAGSRLFIQEQVYDEFLAKVTEAAKAIKVGDPFEDGSQLGPLVSSGHHARVCVSSSAAFTQVYEPRSFIAPSSFYGMGFATSAVPVAKIVYPDRPALCFCGDGSFQMVLPVLPAAADNHLPVTWCVLDDQALGSIRDLQEFRMHGRYLATSFEFQPDFAAIAAACGCYGEMVTSPDQIGPALRRALTANTAGQPAVLGFRVAPDRMEQSREHFNLYPAAR